MAARQVTLYDTTLRDGMQQEGMSVSVDEKVRIALKLDELGIGIIEGGKHGRHHGPVQFVMWIDHPGCIGIDDLVIISAENSHDAVAGGLCLWGNNRQAFTH